MTRAERFAKIQVRLRTISSELLELADEIGHAQAEAPTTGQNAKRLLDLFVSLWQSSYPGEKYVVSGAKHMALLKRVLGTLPVEDVESRIGRYLKNRDVFLRTRKHSLELFIGTINTYAAAAHEPFLTAPAEVDWFMDCKTRHAGQCNGSYAHRLKCDIERIRAGEAVGH